MRQTWMLGLAMLAGLVGTSAAEAHGGRFFGVFYPQPLYAYYPVYAPGPMAYPPAYYPYYPVYVPQTFYLPAPAYVPPPVPSLYVPIYFGSGGWSPSDGYTGWPTLPPERLPITENAAGQHVGRGSLPVTETVQRQQAAPRLSHSVGTPSTLVAAPRLPVRE